MCLAVPGKIVTILEVGELGLRGAKVEVGGILRDVRLDFTPEASVGEYVLVHLGFALSIVDELEAQYVIEALRQVGQLDESREGAT